MSTPTATAPMRFPDLLVYRGYSAPSRIEASVFDLEIDGVLPLELSGTYFRACADPQYPPLLGTDIFINGDGMIHKIAISDGHADLTTRYVRTDKFLAERAARARPVRRLSQPVHRRPKRRWDQSGDGQHVGVLARRQAVGVEGSRTADDARPRDARHPRLLGLRRPADQSDLHRSSEDRRGHRRDDRVRIQHRRSGQQDIEIYWISADGVLERTETFEAPYPSMVHDFSVSERYIAFTICPMVNDWERVERGEPFFHWDSELPTMIAVIPRHVGVAAIRWYRHPQTVMQTHTFNAWDDGDHLHLDHFITASGWLSQFPDLRNPGAHEAPPFAQRWSFDLRSESPEFQIHHIFEHVGEMPVIDPRKATRQHHHYYFGTINHALGPMLDWGPKGPPFTCIGHFDDQTGELSYYYAGPDSAPEEPLFIPRSTDSSEGDGWLITIVGRRSENRTDLVVLDAPDIAAGPVATIRIPFRLHEGFHGTWVTSS